jgi:hypothetical protein
MFCYLPEPRSDATWPVHYTVDVLVRAKCADMREKLCRNISCSNLSPIAVIPPNIYFRVSSILSGEYPNPYSIIFRVF